MPRASCRSSVIAALVEVCASAMSALAASGSSSIFCCARPRVMPTDTSRGWTPSCRSRSMRVRSTSAARTAPARCTCDVRACSASSASREGTMIARVRTPCRRATPTMADEREQGAQDADRDRPRHRDIETRPEQTHRCGLAGEERGERERDPARDDAQGAEDDPSEHRRDRGVRDGPPHRWVDQLQPQRPQEAAETRAAAHARTTRRQPEAVEPVDPGSLEPAEGEQRVLEHDEQHEPDAEHRGEPEADAQQHDQDGEQERPHDADRRELQRGPRESSRRVRARRRAIGMRGLRSAGRWRRLLAPDGPGGGGGCGGHASTVGRGVRAHP